MQESSEISLPSAAVNADESAWHRGPICLWWRLMGHNKGKDNAKVTKTPPH